MTTGEISESSTPLSNHSNRRRPADLIGVAYALRLISLDEGMDGPDFFSLSYEQGRDSIPAATSYYRDTGAPATILRYYHRR